MSISSPGSVRRKRGIRSIRALGAALVVGSTLMAPSAFAALYTWGFTGTMASTSGSIDGLSSLPFGSGDSVSGSYTFDYVEGTQYLSLTAASVTAGGLSIEFDRTNQTATCNIPTACLVAPDGSHVWDVSYLFQDPGSDYGAGIHYALMVAGPDSFANIGTLFEIHIEDYGNYILDPPYGDPILGPLADPLDPTEPFDVSDPGIAISQVRFGWRAPSSLSSTEWSGYANVETLVYVAPVPEPSSALLIGLGLVALRLRPSRGRESRPHPTTEPSEAP